MKIAPFIAAGLMLAGIGVSTEANAQSRHERVVYVEHDRGYGYGHRGGYRDGYGHGWRRPAYYYGGRHHRRCFTEWRHHRRVTICR